jgi:hypothetical protein
MEKIKGIKVKVDIPEGKLLNNIIVCKTDKKNEFMIWALSGAGNDVMTTEDYFVNMEVIK